MNCKIVSGVRLSLALLGLSGLLVPGAAVSAADVEAGQKLHTTHCNGCHQELTGGDPYGLYTRPQRKVTTLAALQKQVRFCAETLQKPWFDEDIDNVVEYLNAQFYQFKP